MKTHHGDAFEFLETLETDSVDVGVTSPPYNLGGDFHSSSKGGARRTSYGAYSEFDDNLPEQEYQISQILVLNELHRVIKPTGWLFYNHKNRIVDGAIISPLDWIRQTDWIVYQDIVIDMKGSTNNDSRRFYPSHEFVYVLSAKKGNKLNNHEGFTSVWSFPQVNRIEAGHPASFHQELPRRCLAAVGLREGVVIDPYMGIGSTGIVAKKMGLDFIGCEKALNYYLLATAALTGELTNQISFFDMQNEEMQHE